MNLTVIGEAHCIAVKLNQAGDHATIKVGAFDRARFNRDRVKVSEQEAPPRASTQHIHTHTTRN